MVKVCNFSFIDNQRIISPKTGEPLAIACSDEHLFVAEEGCVLEVYPLTSPDPTPIAQLRTVSPVVQLVYNSRGDCIVTLERKSSVTRTFARVYFKWRGSSIDRPMRVSLIGSLAQGLLHGAHSQHVAAEIVELPADETFNVTCLAVCKDSGRIAIGMDSTIRVFTLNPEYEGGRGSRSSEEPPGAVSSYSIEILLDIQTSVNLKKLDIFNDYLAFISSCEARVLKLSFLSDTLTLSSGCVPDSEASSTTAGWESDLGGTTPTSPRPPKVQLIDRAKETGIKNDENFVSWSPSKVWEEERLSSSPSVSMGSSGNNFLSHDLEPHPLYDSTRLHAYRSPSPHIETLALSSITVATQEKNLDRHPLEVLGPVEYVWGQPVEVRMEEATPTRCRVLTMLYRRFPMSRGEADQPPRRSATMSLPPRSGRRQEQRDEDSGLHSVELVPVRVEDSQAVIGVSCFIGSHLHGYLYDVALKSRLISSFSFMSHTRAVASDSTFFHALSQGSVETFSNRAMQAALWNKPPADSVHTKWLKQPCPNPNMDLTLMSSNKLIGGCCLASSRDYLVVLTKSGDSQPQTGNWLLQSLRRPTVEPTWNIYILTKKDPLPLYQQFVEYGESVKGTSPPMYQHVISEAHVLLRSQLLQNDSLSTSVCGELDKMLCENCFSLADSLCAYSRGPKSMITNAAKYFILSGAPLTKVVQHISTNYSKGWSPPYQVLLKYISLVLGLEDCRTQLEPVANTVLDLFAQFKPKQLAHVILSSPLGELSPDHALSLLSNHLQGLPRSPDLFKGQLCQVILMLRTEREEEAREIIRQLPEDFLTGWLKDNVTVAMDTNTMQFTHLGKVLWSQWENCLLELLYHCLTSHQLTLEDICTLLEMSEDLGQLADNTLLKGFLERIILDKTHESNPTLSHTAALHLVDVLLARLVSHHSPRPPSSSPFSLYGNRHKWLDALPPFDGSPDSQPPTQTVLQDLMQLQAVLCSSSLFPVGQVANHTQTFLEGCGQELVGSLSLKLLTWSHTGKLREAALLALQEAPHITVDFCLTYFPPELSSWRDLLSLLLDHLLRAMAEGDHLTNTYKALYKAALDHIVTLTTPDEFLSLLPSTGALDFYLPFVESSLRQYLARQLAGRLNTSPLK